MKQVNDQGGTKDGMLVAVRDDDTWEDWVLYMLQAVEVTARQTVTTVKAIKAALFDYKHRIRDGYRFYSQDLINNLFMHPYTKIEFVQRECERRACPDPPRPSSRARPPPSLPPRRAPP